MQFHKKQWKPCANCLCHHASASGYALRRRSWWYILHRNSDYVLGKVWVRERYQSSSIKNVRYEILQSWSCRRSADANKVVWKPGHVLVENFWSLNGQNTCRPAAYLVPEMPMLQLDSTRWCVKVYFLLNLLLRWIKQLVRYTVINSVKINEIKIMIIINPIGQDILVAKFYNNLNRNKRYQFFQIRIISNCETIKYKSLIKNYKISRVIIIVKKQHTYTSP